MSEFGYFAVEMTKIAFRVQAPPVLTGALGKTTKGVIQKPLTTAPTPKVKTPLTATSKLVRSSGVSKGTKIDPTRSSPPPPSATYGGSLVR